MASKHLKQNPLAEVFGFKIDNFRSDAERFRTQKMCPFGGELAEKAVACSKDKAKDPLGVCSINHKDGRSIICPNRFKEDLRIQRDASRFIFEPGVTWTALREVRLKDGRGDAVGNVDYVLVQHTRDRRVLDFGGVEIQAVYITGNVRDPFEKYISDPRRQFMYVWDGDNFPKPDFLSSQKRLIAQLLSKGQVFNAWGKKQVVVIDRPFYESMPVFNESTQASSDLCWLIYKVDDSSEAGRYTINLDKTVYSGFESTMNQIGKLEVGAVAEFVETLEKKLGGVIEELIQEHGVYSTSELLEKIDREKRESLELNLGL